MRILFFARTHSLHSFLRAYYNDGAAVSGPVEKRR